MLGSYSFISKILKITNIMSENAMQLRLLYGITDNNNIPMYTYS